MSLTSLNYNPVFRNAMHLALSYAKLCAARSCADVPVGAVCLDSSMQVIAVASNEMRHSCDPTAHAEIICLRKASARLRTPVLNGCWLVTTLEPCLMCTGALVHARVSGLVFGARNAKAGMYWF